MKLFTTKQIAALDKYTIENEPISDIDLMEHGLFGSGLTRPLDGLAAEIVQKINAFKVTGHPTQSRVTSKNTVVSIDIPSGLMGEDNSGNNYENIMCRLILHLLFNSPK